MSFKQEVLSLFFYNFGVLFSLRDLNFFHSFNCFLLLMVFYFVFYCYFILYYSFYGQFLVLRYKHVEFFCSLIPVFILLFQIVPRLFLLWKRNFMVGGFLSVKIIGHQWYWSYEIGDCLGLEFDSYIKGTDNITLGDFRFLEVDNRLVLPVSIPIRFIITSADVIHSWALPCFFLKLDAMSGLLSVFCFTFDLIGVFYGQCSEICGANHRFIPIVVEVTLFDLFKNWVLTL